MITVYPLLVGIVLTNNRKDPHSEFRAQPTFQCIYSRIPVAPPETLCMSMPSKSLAQATRELQTHRSSHLLDLHLCLPHTPQKSTLMETDINQFPVFHISVKGTAIY